MDALQKKYQALKEILTSLGSVAVAFSGGVDSTLLLAAAKEALGSGAMAVTVSSLSFPRRELKEAGDFCRAHGIRQVLCQVNELEIEGFRQNPQNRCYLCKRELFSRIWDIARENGMNAVAEGSNTDDESDYRPGMQAVRELQVRSPLREAGLSKAEIRLLSRELGLPTWDKPSYACLATRIAYGETISEEKLKMVDRAEQLLIDLGFRQVRVRVHGAVARIELPPESFGRFMVGEIRGPVYRALKDLGFRYVALDLGGYRSGSMNEALPKEQAAPQ